MGYLVENDHAHIDFHKGTHGYPITNADDMMKPCPLMPDGEWLKIKCMCTNDGTDITSTNEISNATSTITESEAWSDYGIAMQVSSTAIYLGLTPSQNNYIFGEVRMSYEGSGVSGVYFTVQGSNAWRITPIGVQEYFFANDSQLVSKVASEFTLTFYAYVIKNESGDE